MTAPHRLGVEELYRPATVAKPAAGVLRRTTGGLHHTVQTHELAWGYPSSRSNQGRELARAAVLAGVPGSAGALVCRVASAGSCEVVCRRRCRDSAPGPGRLPARGAGRRPA